MWMWAAFLAFVVAMLALDLGVFQRRSHVVGVREALGWSAFWIALALAFGAGVYHFQGPERGLEYFAGYVLEKSLSMDNLFVFLLVFGYFHVPAQLQQRVLLWGAFGALAMRGVLIVLGVDLIHHFSWILYAFGLLLLFSGIRMIRDVEPAAVDPARNPLVRACRRIMPVTAGFQDQAFFTRVDGRLHATPLFLVLLVIETSDLAFAIDSIPAVFAVTDDPFIVYTSNVFALLGLRSLYFALAGVIERLHLFKYGLAAVLIFASAKMLLHDVYKVPTWTALAAILGILGSAALASVVFPKQPGYPGEEHPRSEKRHDHPRVPPRPAPRAPRPPRQRP
jgi:tellurite resistance protein TerC